MLGRIPILQAGLGMGVYLDLILQLPQRLRCNLTISIDRPCPERTVPTLAAVLPLPCV